MMAGPLDGPMDDMDRPVKIMLVRLYCSHETIFILVTDIYIVLETL